MPGRPTPHRTRALLAAAVAAVLALPAPAAAWGFLAHKSVNRRAVETLPPGLRPLFAANADYLSEHAVDPDLWRASGEETEGPNHYLDMDAFGKAPPFPEIPHVEADHLRVNGPKATEKGRVPWRVAEVYRELVQAFRDRNSRGALEKAAILGHYVADAHVPLHAVVNYDGQLTQQQGVHFRWEAGVVERFERQLLPRVRLAPLPRAGDPVAVVFDALNESFREAAEVLRSDKECAGPRDVAGTPVDERYDDGYYSRFYEKEEGRLLARLTRSSQVVGALWAQAWVEAGRPALPAFRFPHVRKGVRAVLLSVDGAASWVVDDAVRRGVMPKLAALRARGASGRALSTFPPKTAAGHASLYTGAWSDRHGIVGNEVPVPGGSVLEANNGYTSTHLRAEPIWVTAARQGLQVSVACATQVYPFSPYFEEKRFGGNYGFTLSLIDGYHGVEGKDQVYRAADVGERPVGTWLGPLPAHTGALREVQLDADGAQIDGLLYDDPADPVAGFDTLYLGLDRDPAGGITLKPAPLRTDAEAFASLRVKVAGMESPVFFRLFALSPDGSDLLLYRTPLQVIRAQPGRLEDPALQATGGFVGMAASWAYGDGKLGPTLAAGGDGTAERRFLETVALVRRQFQRLTDFTFDRTNWDLLLAYLPYPDSALHAWLGATDPAVPGYDPALAARVQPYLDEALRGVDDFVGHLADKAGPGVVMAVGTDHGMQGASRELRPNVALAAAGLLAVDASGGVDLARTQAVYFRGNAGSILVNTADRPGGIVTPAQEAEVREKVKAALRAVRDPQGGAPVVLDVLEPGPGQEPPLPPGALYISAAPGYELSASPAGTDVVVPIRPVGSHRLDPRRESMQGAFAIAGPGVAAGVDLGPIRQIDVAPTLCALLGIDPPAQAQGAVLEKVMAP